MRRAQSGLRAWRLAVLWLLGCATGSAHAALDEMTRCAELPSRIEFTGGHAPGSQAEPQRIEHYGARVQTLAANPEGYPGHGLTHGRNCTQRPAGRHTQVMRFRLRARGYFAADVVNHMAIGLRARLTGFAPGVHSGQERFQGRGIVIGSVRSGWTPGQRCPGPFPLVQPETWGQRMGVTQLWGQATEGADHCGPSLADGQWYSFELQADDQSLAYTVRDAQGRVLRRHRFRDTLTSAPDRDEILANSGYFLAVMCADADTTCRQVAPWRLELTDFKVSWR